MAILTEVDYDPFSAPTPTTKGTPSNWQTINAASASLQPKRDSDRLKTLQDEYAQETNPANQALLQREIKRMGATPVTSQKQTQPQPSNEAKLTEVDYDPFAKTQKQAAPKTSFLDDVKQGTGNLLAGAVRGAGSIGATLLAPVDIAKDAINGKGLSLESNRQRRADMDAGLQSMGAEPDAWMYKGGKLAGEIAGTAGTGGAIVGGLKNVPTIAKYAPEAANVLSKFGGLGSTSLATKAPNLLAAIESGGFSTGNKLASKTADLALRSTGGAINGAASAGLIDPEYAGTGAIIGGALPVGVKAVGTAGKAVGTAGKYIWKTVKSVVQPFTSNGQEVIANNILAKFGEGAPMGINAAEIVPGSTPTLAQATGNAGIARAESTIRDLRPNFFVERERANAAARNALFDDLAGDSGKLDFFKASRDQAANDLYGAAKQNYTDNNVTPYVKGQITQLLKRPSIDDASRTAQKWAIERGEKPDPRGSFNALLDVKTALDDKIAESVRQGAGGQVKALQATKNKLLDVMEKLSPEYSEARTTYAEMSKPINQMEALQGLKITDAQGNITLSKIKTAIDSLEKQRSLPGVNAAKSLQDDQLITLKKIHDDLLRQASGGAGKSAGSNTFQNIATDNILSSLLPGKLGGFVTGKVGGVAGQLGKLIYSGPNEAIRNRLADIVLNPGLAKLASQQAPQQLKNSNALRNAIEQSMAKSAPVITPKITNRQNEKYPGRTYQFYDETR